MKLDISGRHLDVTPAMQSHIEEKTSKLKRHFDGLMNVHVTVSLEGVQNEVEFVISAKRHQFVAKAADGQDMYAAIDAVIEKLDRQITRFKDRLQDRRHERKPAEVFVEAEEARAQAEVGAEEAEEAEE